MAVKKTALTTLAHFKTRNGMTTGEDDQLIEQIIDAVSDWIESQTNRKFKRREYNGGSTTHPATGVTDEDYIYFNGYTKDKGGDTVRDEAGYGLFYLPAWPVAVNDDEVTFVLASLSNRGSSVTGGEEWNVDTLVEWDDYIVDRENGVLRHLGGTFEPGFRNYRITMAAGFLEGDTHPFVPADLEQLCLRLASERYDDKSNLQSEKIGTWSRTFDTSREDPFIAQTLQRYSRIVI